MTAMSRRLSTLSTSSHAPTAGPSSAKTPASASAFSPISARRTSGPGLPPPLSRSVSSTASAALETIKYDQDIDPDELFVKHTVAEVKLVQQRLKTEADSKQSELRLMVGERYRDLLQASSSIISIAQSSQRVLEAVQEMKDTVSVENLPGRTRRSTLGGKEDAQLHALQSLAAHVKLLLDAPEHLWRLIEAKKYFHAAWLFLLARVVHRALSAGDVDEVEWPDMDIMDEFPLVQRQWDTISHFRSQIGHKATLSLREHVITTQSVCSIVLTLHLVDSKPLTETLSTILAQRSKTAQILLSRKADAAAAAITPSTRPANGLLIEKASADGEPRSKSRKRVAREAKEASEGALALVSSTLGAARGTFATSKTGEPSLVRRVLSHIQSEVSDSSMAPLPSELALSTSTLLTNLPSASQLLSLPASLRKYKPYVDLESSSSTVSPQELADKLDIWFQRTVREVNAAMERWLADLESVRQVWAVRRSLRKWLDETSEFEKAERMAVQATLDEVCSKRGASIWSASLASIASIFHERLDQAISESVFAEDAAEDIFKPPPALLLGHDEPGSLHAVASYSRYRSALRHQVEGRTPLLDRVLSAVEEPASRLRRDLDSMKGDDAQTRELVDHAARLYDPQAGDLYQQLLETLSNVTQRLGNEPSYMDRVLFVGRIGDELASSTLFMAGIGGTETAQTGFRDKARVLYDLTIDRWRKHIVDQVARVYGASVHGRGASPTAAVSRPSSALADGLLSLSTSIHHMGVSKEHGRRRAVAEETLRVFAAQLLDEDGGPLSESSSADAQSLWDLAFMHRLLAIWGAGCAKASARLRNRIARVREELVTVPSETDMEKSLSAYLARIQLVIDPLLPPSESSEGSLLKYGTPAAEAQFLPAMELVKPSARFGLLLVPGSSVP